MEGELGDLHDITTSSRDLDSLRRRSENLDRKRT